MEQPAGGCVVAGQLLLTSRVGEGIDLGPAQASGDIEPEEPGIPQRLHGLRRQSPVTVGSGGVDAERRADPGGLGDRIDERLGGHAVLPSTIGACSAMWWTVEGSHSPQQ